MTKYNNNSYKKNLSEEYKPNSIISNLDSLNSSSLEASLIRDFNIIII